MTSTPSPPLPESTLVGTAAEYLSTIEAQYRLPVSTFTLRLIAHLREAHCRDGDMLKALAQIECGILPVVRSAASVPRLNVQYVAPPSDQL